MALPLAPVALFALTAYAVARRVRHLPTDPEETALDDTPEGVWLSHQNSDQTHQLGGSARWRRTVRLGARGPGVEIDFAGLARLRVSPCR